MNVATYLDPRYKELPFLGEIQKQRMIDDVEDELLALEIPETTEPLKSLQQRKRRVQFPSCLEICLKNRGKLHYIQTLCQRKWSYTRLKSPLSSTQIPLSGGTNEGRSTRWCADLCKKFSRLWQLVFHRSDFSVVLETSSQKSETALHLNMQTNSFSCLKMFKSDLCTAFDSSCTTLWLDSVCNS